MIKWCALFEDGYQREVLIEAADEQPQRAGVLKRFEDARTANEINGRKVIGMWIIDYATEQADVIKIHGRVPENIDTRFRDHGRLRSAGAMPLASAALRSRPYARGRLVMNRRTLRGVAVIVVGVVANNYIYFHDLVFDKHQGAIQLGWPSYTGIIVCLAVIAVGAVMVVREGETTAGA